MAAAPDRAAAVLRGLDDDQAQAVLAPPGPVRILAGAGTGKTRSVTHRIAYHHLTGAAPVTAVLAVTHSAKAAAEMRTRLDALGVPGAQARTFHAAALRQLSYFWSATGLPGPKPDIVGDNRTLVRYALAAARGLAPAQVASEEVLAAAAEIGWARAQLVDPAGYPARAAAAGRRADLEAALVAETYRRYQQAKRERAVLDFDDVLAVCTRLLETRPDVAGQVRGSYRHFVVDEYQDTDPAQQRLLEAWLGGRDTVCVVGDTAQAIYRFRGAEATLLRTFGDRYPHATTVRLVRDYRSTPQVVHAANTLLAGSGDALRLIGQQPPGPEPQVHPCADETAENDRIVALVRDLVRSGTAPHQIAVLHRFNAQTAAIRAALSDAGFGLRVGRGQGFYDRPEVARVLRRFREEAAHEPDTDAVTLLTEALDAHGFDERQPPAGTGAARERWDNQRALLAAVRSLAKRGTGTGAAVAAELAVRVAAETGTDARGVTVTTIHQAKGLEWDAVILARLTDGSLPSVYATTPADLAEERRLTYVALTRARRVLHLTWARAREGRTNTPSPYLAELFPGTATTGRRSGGGVRSAAGRRRAPVAGYATGGRVNHDRYGLGTVTAVDGARARIDFGDGRVRTVHLDRDPVEPL